MTSFGLAVDSGKHILFEENRNGRHDTRHDIIQHKGIICNIQHNNTAIMLNFHCYAILPNVAARHNLIGTF
jgi:hypothetical protein